MVHVTIIIRLNKTRTKMSKTKLKILTPTGVIIKDLEIELGEYTSDFRILVEHDEYRVLYTKEVTTENQNKDE